MIINKRCNAPVWKDLFTSSKMPESLSKLDEIAHNLWWVWNPEAKALFKSLNPSVWHENFGNPVMLLQSLSQSKIEEMVEDSALQARIADIYAKFRAYIDEKPDTTKPSVAYFSMEYGLTNILKTYSGGLGVLAGDYLKEASDTNIDLVAVGFLYRFGYFDQTITSDGQQVAVYKPQDFDTLPITQLFDDNGRQVQIAIPFLDHTLMANVWSVSVGRVTLYLLDTDIQENNEWDRTITHQLYGGDWENRMRQEYLLGIGGIELLNRLGIKKDIYHCNEGHAAFINAERLANYIEKEGLTFLQALELVRASSLYTVHTPVPAGHDYFDESLFGKYMGRFADRLGISFHELVDMGRENPGSGEKFSMSVFALNTCQEANGVSFLHGKVSQEMFAPVWKGFFAKELHVGYVTNGVHLPTWTQPEWKTFIEEKISSDICHTQEQESVWNKIQDVDNEEIWKVRTELKQKFIRYIQKHYGDNWVRNNGDPSKAVDLINSINPKALLIGFGRRFATYKRAHLLFTDLDRLSKIVNNSDQPVQFIYTGKAHPADGGGQGLIKHIVDISKRPEFSGKILFLENYDMQVASMLIAGVDVWLNTPTRPLEASGTSGMKALMNGVLNFSVLDGWWFEGYREKAGWALTDKKTFQNQHHQDQLDAATIYHILEEELIPLYYNRAEGKEYSDEWIQWIKNSMNYVLPHYTMRRMLQDYIERFYNPLASRFRHISADSAKIAKELVEWKKDISEKWDQVAVEDCSMIIHDRTGDHSLTVGEMLEVNLHIDKRDIAGDLLAELIEVKADKEDANKLLLEEVTPLEIVEQNGSKVHYRIRKEAENPGHHKLAVRLLPTHPALPHKMDFSLVRWVNID